jgi:hypothetical protein
MERNRRVSLWCCPYDDTMSDDLTDLQLYFLRDTRSAQTFTLDALALSAAFPTKAARKRARSDRGGGDDESGFSLVFDGEEQ